MDSASFAVWRRLQSIQQEYRAILQEFRHTPRAHSQRGAQLSRWAGACGAEYLAVFRQWNRRPRPVDALEDADRDDAGDITPSA